MEVVAGGLGEPAFLVDVGREEHDVGDTVDYVVVDALAPEVVPWEDVMHLALPVLGEVVAGYRGVVDRVNRVLAGKQKAGLSREITVYLSSLKGQNLPGSRYINI